MIELAATAIITASSTLLFGYWFRYTCLLILSAKTTRDYAGEVAAANQLTFLHVQSELRGNNPDLNRLHEQLDRDYKLLSFLFRNAADSDALEDVMLRFNYRLMGVWCKAARPFSNALASKALEEMTMVVAHFANAVGERAACPGAA